MKKALCISAALAAIFAASPAAAQFSGFNKPSYGNGSFASSASPQTLLSASEGAKINRIRAAAGADQNRPVKTCDTDVAYGTNDSNRPQLTSRRQDTYVGNIEVYSGGFCSGANRRRQF